MRDTLEGSWTDPRGEKEVYLLNVIDGHNVVEASLGGRIDADEMRVFGEELGELMADLGVDDYSVVFDYSRAKPLDGQAKIELGWIKDSLIDQGAQKIVNVARDDMDIVDGTTARLQHVLEGREEFVLETHKISFPQVRAACYRLAA